MADMSTRLAAEVDRVLRRHGRSLKKLGPDGQRVKVPMSYQDAAGVTGLSSTAIWKMHKGHMPTGDTIERFAAGLGENPVEWLGWFGLEPGRRSSYVAAEREYPAYVEELIRSLERVPAPERVRVARAAKAMIESLTV